MCLWKDCLEPKSWNQDHPPCYKRTLLALSVVLSEKNRPGYMFCIHCLQRWIVRILWASHIQDLADRRKGIHSWQFFVTFLGWLSDPFRGLVTSNQGIKNDKKVTLNHLVSNIARIISYDIRCTKSKTNRMKYMSWNNTSWILTYSIIEPIYVDYAAKSYKIILKYISSSSHVTIKKPPQQPGSPSNMCRYVGPSPGSPGQNVTFGNHSASSPGCGLQTCA